MNEFETYGEDEVTCPYCETQVGDSWELGGDEGERECYECGKKYEWYRNVSVDYSTVGIEEEK